jgi:hypothetical protein
MVPPFPSMRSARRGDEFAVEAPVQIRGVLVRMRGAATMLRWHVGHSQVDPTTLRTMT